MPRPTAQPLMGHALITGASSGIGAAFARRLGAEGRPLILVARDPERLRENSAELRAQYTVPVEILVADLAGDIGREAVAQRLASVAEPVDTLVNNAGFGLYKPFGKAELADERRMLAVNVLAVLELSHAAVAAMGARGRGEIINISSTAGFVPRGPSATYAASKAWVTSFTESLALVLRGSGVQVCAVCPGFTRTEFHQRAEKDRASVAPSWMWLDADRVVADGLKDARAGKVVSVPSRRYTVLVGAAKLAPRPALAWVMARQ